MRFLFSHGFSITFSFIGGVDQAVEDGVRQADDQRSAAAMPVQRRLGSFSMLGGTSICTVLLFVSVGYT
ncbi:MAG: hypothetical protein CSA33_00280 [Desulfobulbus propionicus]|nr:MAG: hypothetical protein CSA33_00280 [Desulfobulbus propionicus]